MIVVAAASFIAGRTFTPAAEMPAPDLKADHESRPGSTDSTEREILYWQAPMNPAEIYDEPGKSAMGMDLVPVYADQAPGGAVNQIRINPATVQNMGVRTARAVRSDFSRTIRTVGKVEYDEEARYRVNTKVSGWVEELYVDFTGAPVKKGEPLLEIYSPELVATQEEFLLSLRSFERMTESPSESLREDAKRVLESARERLRYWDIPDSEIERLERTREVARTVAIESPASGIVVSKTVVDGSHVMAGTDLYEIADLSDVWVHASLYDFEVPWVRQGQQATMELAYLPERSFSGTVSYIYPYLRDKARDVHVRLVFENPEQSLKPGMYVNVELETSVIEDALLIPTEAVLRTGPRAIVFIDVGAGSYQPREVRIGEEGGPDNRFVRVLSGLQEGEKVVTSAQFLLDSESRLQEAIQKMLATGEDDSTSPTTDHSGHEMDHSMHDSTIHDDGQHN